jgi:hypothetical protein
MPQLTITDIFATDADGMRTVTGSCNGVVRRISVPILELERLTFEEAQARFIAEFRKLLELDPKPYPLPFSEFTVEI